MQAVEDNPRKGVTLNAVQITEQIVGMRFFINIKLTKKEWMTT